MHTMGRMLGSTSIHNQPWATLDMPWPPLDSSNHSVGSFRGSALSCSFSLISCMLTNNDYKVLTSSGVVAHCT